MTTNKDIVKMFKRFEQTLKMYDMKLNMLLQGDMIIMTELSDAVDSIEAAAEADSSADSAAMAMLTKLADLVKNATVGGTDPAMVARVNAVAAAMKSRAEALSAAVVANTPADPESPPDTGASTGGARSGE